ncbi:MAG TPA: site-specific DNA-methyltransferase [Terriglobales bacterium]|nr:site-specific DNA-methyltransferase [Terriglobales bacterium]
MDDLDSATAPQANQYLAKVKAIRGIAHKLIDFLAQLEDFQKKLWLKKKFVTEVNYCITVDRIAPELYPAIVENNAQVQEWGELLRIGNLPKDVFDVEINPQNIRVEDLKRLPSLVVDTCHFDQNFRDALLSNVQDFDESISGLLIQGDNAHSLRLIQEAFKDRIRCTYIDPPYNRGGDDFNYKDNYQHSSWLTMIRERLAMSHPLLAKNGVIFASIDENERANLEHALSEVFGGNNRVEELIWVQNTTHSQSPTYSTNHEYVEVFAKNKPATMQEPSMYREPKPGFVELQDLVTRLNPEYPSIEKVQEEIQKVMMQHLEEYKQELASMGLQYNSETKKQDPWRGIYSYSFAEYRDPDGRLVPESEAKAKNATLVIWTESDASMPAAKQSPTTRDPNDDNFRFYKPPHPITGQPCPHPKTGWRMPYRWPDESRESFERFAQRDRIVWGKDETKVPRYKRFLHEVETNVAKSVIHDYTDGEKQVADLFGRANAFPNPKPSTLIQRFILQTCSGGDYVMDFFAGSGTTFQATWEAAEELRKPLRFVASDMGAHFDDIMLPRLKKLMFSKRWVDGIPNHKEGRSAMVKYLRLESYEDALNNLRLRPRTFAQQSLLDSYESMREDYLLRYMLNVEAEASASLLSVDHFGEPFNCSMQIATGTVGETRSVTIDLVETFNYLIGLRVTRVDHHNGFRIVEGHTSERKAALVIWRNTKEKSIADLDAFFLESYNTRKAKIDIIYVNGDNHLENLRSAQDRWEVRLIEKEFQERMFDGRDV